MSTQGYIKDAMDTPQEPNRPRNYHHGTHQLQSYSFHTVVQMDLFKVLIIQHSSSSKSTPELARDDHWSFTTSSKGEFSKNEVVQKFLTRTNDEIVASLKESYEALSHRDELIRNETGEGLEEKTGGASEDGDISFIVTVCCEEGCHRSVAFMEELAQRLIMLRMGDDWLVEN
ncbi:hypothetical protein N7467_010470 [Penicillium canescens]|nr:hypothetical protein N7467_010470 [Penicillium canescens]